MSRSSVHPAWIVLGALALAMLGGTGVRSVFGVYIKPMETEFGWSRSALSGVAAVSLLVFGAVGPLAGRLADHRGPRRVITLSLALLGIGTVGSAFVHQLWHLYLTAGLLTAIGSGATQPSGAAVVARWFEARRGLALGIMGGAMSASQLVIIPLATALTVTLGWRASFLALGIALLVLVLPIGAAFIRNDPEERGLRPYGATGRVRLAAEVSALLTANIFGRYSVDELMGWISFSHQVGTALLAFVASALVFAIREEPIVSRPTPAPAPA